MSIFFRRRTSEATAQQLVATGAGGGYGIDPIDGDTGYRRLGQGSAMDIPYWSRAKAQRYSLASYRANPMGRAIIDTYTSFCVGDSGLTLQVSDPEVRKVAEAFWTDPANLLSDQAVMLRTVLLLGESAYEMMVGPSTGVVRRSVIDPTTIDDVALRGGNPLWPTAVEIRRVDGAPLRKTVIAPNDITGQREGEVLFLRGFRSTELDLRGSPFLGPVLDWLDSYDRVLSNLIDRTALARYMVWDVTVDGGDAEVKAFVESRKGTHAPRSGSVEVHNDAVKWEAKSPQVGAYEDRVTGQSVLTSVAAGTGLAKTWLAEPEDANRATSLSMAEPVRRRVNGVQLMWLGYQTEMVRFAVDRAVAARRIPATVTLQDGETTRTIPAAEAVKVTGPEVAAADAKITAEVLVSLATALTGMRSRNLLSEEAARRAAKKGWEDFMGVPYSPELDSPEADSDELASYIDDQDDGSDVEGDRRRRGALALLG